LVQYSFWCVCCRFFNGKNRLFTSKYQEKFALYSSKLSYVPDPVKEIKLFALYKKETDEIDLKVKDFNFDKYKKNFLGIYIMTI
jgi:hypothetical protein